MTDIATTTAPARPTVEQIDGLALRCLAAKTAVSDAQKLHDDVEAEAIQLVQQFGIVPPKAENSRRLDGRYNTLTVTVGNSTSIAEARVQQLQEALEANKFGGIFANLFRERVRHEALQDAPKAILAAGMNARLTEKVQALFARCFSTTPKAPVLKVKQIVEKPAKKARAKKTTGA